MGDHEVAERTLATMVQNYDASKAALEGKLDALKKADVELSKAQKQELAAIDLMLADHQDQALEAKDAKKTAAKSARSCFFAAGCLVTQASEGSFSAVSKPAFCN